MKKSLLNALFLIAISLIFFSEGFVKSKVAIEQNFLSIKFGSKLVKLTGNDVTGSLSHTKQLGVSGSHFGNSLLVTISAMPYKLGQIGTFLIKYPTDGTTLLIMEDGQPIVVTKGKIIISSASQNHVTGSFSGMSMDGKTVLGTFGSRVVTSESARKGL